VLTARDRAEAGDLYRATLADGWAATCEVDSLSEVLGVDDRVAAERQRGAGLANRATVVQHGVAGSIRASPRVLNHSRQAAAASGLDL
jgi:hypothetical protein